MARRKQARTGDLRLTGLATAQLSAFVQQLRSGSAMDRAIHTTATEQARVRRVDDRVSLGVLSDVPEMQRDASGHGSGKGTPSRAAPAWIPEQHARGRREMSQAGRSDT
jgi:hypothetical protein